MVDARTRAEISRSVLIIEDDDDLRQLYHYWLIFAGFDVRVAANGLDGLNAIDESPPDLIVLDIRLPIIDGLSVRQQMATDPRTRNIPVIVVTGATVDLKRLKAARVLQKPVLRDELVAAVRDAFSDRTPGVSPKPRGR